MPSILFVLPVSGGSGGAHSVMQEADAMRALGVNAMIATNTDNAPRLQRAYRDLAIIRQHIHPYQGSEGLGDLIRTMAPDMVVATTNQSVHTLAEAIAAAGLVGQRTAYYVQDYEPLFYDKGSNDWHLAFSSFGAIPGMVHFAKTRWLQEVVEANHRVQVLKVEPSIDHRVYRPDLSDRATYRGKLRIVAMLRPATPRRAPRRTVRLLNRIAADHADSMTCATFGCSAEEMKQYSLRLSNVENLGILSREDVGEAFRQTDLFVDLSDFQAFGRTAIEAMSCGAAAIVPAHGGAYEFAEDGRNAFVVDTRSDDAIWSAITQFAAMSEVERHDMRLRGIAAGYRYTPERAALSEIAALGL